MDTNSKKKKVDDHHVDSDRLSDLPLSIIHIILALIPIREAVRTSVLSTQWRYTWTTLPQLVFNDNCVSRNHKSVTSSEFVNRVLFRHKGPIHKFRLSCSGSFPDVDEWIFCLSRNDVRELIINAMVFRLYSCLEMTTSLYSCKRLTYLSLCNCRLDPPPLTFKGFMFLRCLCLRSLHMYPDEIYSLVAVCPLLESIEIINVNWPELEFSAPNLKYMHLVGAHQKLCINAPRVTEISVQMYNYDMEPPDQELQSSACEYASCFAGFTNLQKLRGSGYFTKFMSYGIELCHHSLVFHRLKLIDVDVHFEDVKEIMVLARLVTGAPSLQELIIRSFEDDSDSDSEAPDLSMEDLGFTPNFKLENLTDVSLVHFCSDLIPLEAEFLKVLFESSPVLETVSVWVDTEVNQDKVRAILQGCNWASPPILKPCCKKTIADKPDRFLQPF